MGTFICVTGVSGSGKSTLINQTLHPALHNHFYEETKRPLPFKKLTGLQHLDKVIAIDQDHRPDTRSNPATYGVFNEIRNLFTQLPEAKIRGYKPGLLVQCGRRALRDLQRGRTEDHRNELPARRSRAM